MSLTAPAPRRSVAPPQSPALRAIDIIQANPEHAAEYERALQAVNAVARWRAAAESLPAVSPQVARSLVATERLWNAMDEEFGLLSAAELGRRLGSRAKDPSSMVAKRQQAGQLIGFKRQNRMQFPAFQLDPRTGDVFPVIPELVARAAKHGLSSRDVAQWLMSSRRSLGGGRPVDALADAEAVLRAAAQTWDIVW